MRQLALHAPHALAKSPSRPKTIHATGGDMASTRVAKLQVHAEVQVPRKTVCKLIVANDDNYALAA